MNLIRFFAILAAATAGEARLNENERNLAKDGAAEEGTCLPAFDEEGELVFGPFAGKFTVCEDTLVKVGSVGAARGNDERFIKPQNGDGFVNFAVWEKRNKEATLQCFHAKGYSVTEEEVDDGLLVTIKGHYLLLLFAADEFTGENPNGLTTPGAYWMSGGNLQFLIGAKNWKVTRAQGDYFDVCAAIEN